VTEAYPPLGVSVETPRLELLGATDELLYELLPTVRAGVVSAEENPFDDPISLYDESPQREWRWLRGIWKGRASVGPGFWRLYFVVRVDGELVGMQDLLGLEFGTYGTVASFSWLAPGARGHGLGAEMRSAILHLAFAGMGAREATSDAFLDNASSNRVSEKAGYVRNGVEWATRRGQPAQLQRWVLPRRTWLDRQRDDIRLSGVEECRKVLGI
jgi:RimJ/RimL family protein N-acetyltransferase